MLRVLFVGTSDAGEVVQISQTSGNSLGKTISQHCILVDTKKFESAKEGNGTLTSHSPLPSRKESRKGCGIRAEERSQVCLSSPGGPGQLASTFAFHCRFTVPRVSQNATHSALS